MDVEILKYFSKKEHYDLYSQYVKRYTVGEETSTILKSYGEYFKTKDEIVDWNVFKTWFYITNGVRSDTICVYDEIFKAVDDGVEPDEEELMPLIKEFIKKDYATQILEVSTSVLDGKKNTLEDVDTLLAKYRDTTGEAVEHHKYFVTDDFDELVEDAMKPGYRWRMPFLNESIGDLKDEMFVMVAARPDSGKTSFLANEVSFMIPQMEDGEYCLWFNNEQAGGKVKRRVIMNAIGWSTADIIKNRAGAFAELKKVWGSADRLKVFNKPAITVRDVEKILREYEDKVGLIVFDQLWKIHSSDKEGETARQTKLAAWAREICKEYAPVMNSHQADAQAHGEKWIEMDRLYGSKTGIQGEADVIITLGRSLEVSEQRERYIYVPKNKEPDGTDPLKANGKHISKVDMSIGRFL